MPMHGECELSRKYIVRFLMLETAEFRKRLNQDEWRTFISHLKSCPGCKKALAVQMAEWDIDYQKYV